MQDEAGASGFGIFFRVAQLAAASGKLDGAAAMRFPPVVTK
jgi:hypothetical protein